MKEIGKWSPGLRVLEESVRQAAAIQAEFSKLIGGVREAREVVRREMRYSEDEPVRLVSVVTTFADGSREELVEAPGHRERWTYTPPRVVDEAQGVVKAGCFESLRIGSTGQVLVPGMIAWLDPTSEVGPLPTRHDAQSALPPPVAPTLEKRIDRVRAYYAKKLGRSVEQLRADRIGEGRWDQPAHLAALEAQIDAEERREDFWSMAGAALWGFALIGSALAGLLFYAAATGV